LEIFQQTDNSTHTKILTAVFSKVFPLTALLKNNSDNSKAFKNVLNKKRKDKIIWATYFDL
jgi:hypothetical protein